MFSSLKSNNNNARQSIFLVDANPNASLVEALEAAGYQVKSYDHPMTALEEIGDHSVKVAIVAEELPWIKGPALARTLRESYRVTNVIMMDRDMSVARVMAQVRSGSPIESEPEPVKPRARKLETATTSRTGRRIIVRRSPRS